jgi:hypothetical protein
MDEIGGSGPCGEKRRKRQRKKEERLIKIN